MAKETVVQKPQNVASIILGSLSIVPLFWIFPVGLIFGIIGLALHDPRGDKIGFGLSLAGTIIGAICVLVWMCALLASM